MSTPETFEELLRDELTPAPDPAFAAQMDEWVAQGFPAVGRERKPRRRLSFPRLVSPVGLAGAGTALAALAIAAVLVVDTGEQTSTETESSGGAAADQTTLVQPSPQEVPGDAERSAVPPATGGGIAPGETTRRIERSAQLTLAAPADEFQGVADQVIRVTDRHDGFVLRSNVSTGDSPSGDFQLRVPGDQLQATLRDLAALGDVRARSDSGQDVTQEYVRVTDGLAAARAERRGLLRRLATAEDDARMQRLRDRLDANASELASLRGQVRDLRERTNYAAVTLTLVERDGDSGGAAGPGPGGTEDALDDSLGLLVGSFNLLVRALGVVIPLGLAGGAIWWAGRTLRRRRREAVLS